MTTPLKTREEKKRVLCYGCHKPIHVDEIGGVTVIDGKEVWFHNNTVCIMAISTPPETGMEWKKDLDMWLFNWGIIPDGKKQSTAHTKWQKEMYTSLTAFIRMVESSALAQGEKIGAEKERDRLSGWLMHDDNCMSLYYDPKKTNKCDCGLADALKG